MTAKELAEKTSLLVRALGAERDLRALLAERDELREALRLALEQSNFEAGRALLAGRKANSATGAKSQTDPSCLSELREALRAVLPLATHGNVCRGCWTVVPMLCEERCEVRMAHALLERLSRHPAQPVKGAS